MTMFSAVPLPSAILPVSAWAVVSLCKHPETMQPLLDADALCGVAAHHNVRVPINKIAA